MYEYHYYYILITPNSFDIVNDYHEEHNILEIQGQKRNAKILNSPAYDPQNKKLKSTRRSNHRHQEEQVHWLYQFWSWSTIPHKIVVVNEQSFSNSLRLSESAYGTSWYLTSIIHASYYTVYRDIQTAKEYSHSM